MEEAPSRADTSNSRKPSQLFLLSAKSPRSLDLQTQSLAHYLDQTVDVNLGDVSYTLQIGRKHFNHRRFFLGEDVDQIKDLLKAKGSSIKTSSEDPIDREIIFMFSGQGSQYVKMGGDLYRHEPMFKQEVDKCADLAEIYLNCDIRELIFAETEGVDAAEKLKQTAITQPALFIIEYALSKLWNSWGIIPTAMVGHSIGEYVAACLSGVMSLEDSIKLVCERGRLMQSVPKGSMLAVQLSEPNLVPYLNHQLSLAVLNGPSVCVVSGEDQKIAALQENLSKDRIDSTPLKTSHAFHSVMMVPILEEFTEIVASIKLNPPEIPFYSNVSGELITEKEACDPAYWAKHIRHTVRFVDCVSNMLNGAPKLFLEVGPGKTLATFVKQHPDRTGDHMIYSTTRHPKEKTCDMNFILHTVGEMWMSGAEFDWKAYYGDERRVKIPLPTYCFDRKRFWIGPDPNKFHKKSEPSSVKSKKLPNTSDWFYVPKWDISKEEVSFEGPRKKDDTWLIFLDNLGVGKELATHANQAGIEVVQVASGDKFIIDEDQKFYVDFSQRDHYNKLFAELKNQNKQIGKIVHLWSLGEGLELHNFNQNAYDESQRKGLYSILQIAQSLAREGYSDPIEFEIISNNLQNVNKEDIPNAEKATILGACKVIPQEYTNINCRSIDFGDISSNIESMTQQVWMEVNSDPTDLMIAYRGAKRYTHGYEQVKTEDNKSEVARIKEGGSYIITGGLGGMGLVLAEHISRIKDTKILLLGRSSFPERIEWENYLNSHSEDDSVSKKLKKLLAMEENGMELMIRSADISDLEQMAKVINDAISRFGKINGIVHTAGVIDLAGVIHKRTWEMTEEVMDAKVKGTIILDHLLQDQNLDFFALFSSIGTVLYNVKFGQVGYVAANEFLDSYTYQRTKMHGAHTITINWDDWQEVGMAVAAIEGLAKSWGEKDPESYLIDAILPDEGYDVFCKSVNSTLPRLIISTHSLHDRLQSDQMSEFQELENDQDSENDNHAYARPDLDNDYQEPQNDIELKITNIWQELLGIDRIGREDDFFDLGGDSLVATRMFRYIEKQLGKSLPLTTIFDQPTVQGIAQQIENSSESKVKQGPKIVRVSREAYRPDSN